MPRPAERTRSRKPMSKPLPGGRTRIHFRRKIGVLPKCIRCGQQLAGIQRSSPLKMRKLNRSRRRVWRLYGGQLCPSCLKNSLRTTVRKS